METTQGPAGIGRVDHAKLRESVYEELCAAFTRGAFAPGDTLSLRALADDLGTSLTPVREAVRRLVAEGALIDTPSRTLKVASFDADRLAELKSARLALEALLLDRAMARMDDATLGRLDRIVTLPSLTDGRPNLEANHAFHFALYEAAESDVILPVVRALWLRYGAYLNLVVHRPEAAEVAEHEFHRAIIAALRSGDAAAAHAALAQDIERSFAFLTRDA